MANSSLPIIPILGLFITVTQCLGNLDRGTHPAKTRT
jgi:hypothetical protein